MARLSVFDVTQPSNPRLLAEIPVGLEPVSVNPRNNDEVWVVNEVSDSISVVSVPSASSRHDLCEGRAADVVFAGGNAFVSAARKNLLAVFDATTHNLVTNITLFGENPRALVVNTNATKSTRFRFVRKSHNDRSGGQSSPAAAATNTSLPPAPQVGADRGCHRYQLYAAKDQHSSSTTMPITMSSSSMLPPSPSIVISPASAP